MVEFTVYGLPVAQGRPKFYRRGKQVGCYDPAKSKAWKSEVRRFALERGAKIQEGPLDMTLYFYLPRPKSLPKKVRHHTRRPDLDNYCKSVLDALKGVFYRDDSQIICLIARKGYVQNGEQTGVVVQVGPTLAPTGPAV